MKDDKTKPLLVTVKGDAETVARVDRVLSCVGRIDRRPRSEEEKEKIRKALARARAVLGQEGSP